jgi:glutamyl-tRNA reductase
MSATEFGEALERQFAEVHQREMKRLERKLAALGSEQRASAEEIIADVIRTLARTPMVTLPHDDHPRIVSALAQLFRL